MAFMLARQQMFLRLGDEMEESYDLIDIMSNSQLNNYFLSLAREVSARKLFFCSRL